MVNNSEDKPCLLFYVQLPPPTHGTSLDNQRIVNSELLRDSFEIDVIEVFAAESLDDLGKWSLRKTLGSIGSFLKLCCQAFKTNPKLIYVTPAPSGPAFLRDAIFYFILKILGFRLVTRIKGSGFSKGGFLKDNLASWMFSNTYPVILSELLQYDIDKYVNSDSIKILPNGIPDHFPHNSLDKSRVQDRPLRLLYLANWHPSKGLLKTLETGAILQDSGVSFQLDLAGSPTSELSELAVKKTCDNLGISEHVNLVGPIYGKDKFNKFYSSDVFIYPTRWDCFPFVVLEAMSAGLPIVSTTLAAIPDMVEDGWNGYLLKPDCTPEELAEVVSKLISNDDKRRHFGERSRQRFLDEFQFDVIMKRLRALFLDIIDKPKI